MADTVVDAAANMMADAAVNATANVKADAMVRPESGTKAVEPTTHRMISTMKRSERTHCSFYAQLTLHVE